VNGLVVVDPLSLKHVVHAICVTDSAEFIIIILIMFIYFAVRHAAGGNSAVTLKWKKDFLPEVCTSSVEVYDPATKMWSPGPELANALCGAGEYRTISALRFHLHVTSNRLLDSVTDLTSALLLPVKHKPQTTCLRLGLSCAAISIVCQLYLKPQSTCFLQKPLSGIRGSVSSSGPCSVYCSACLAMLLSLYNVCPR